MSFAANLRRLRVSRGLTQTELAGRVPCTPVLISYYENDKRRPSLAMFEAIADTLACSPRDLSPALWRYLKRRQQAGTRVRALRRQAGVTQAELASHVYVSHSLVSKWENNYQPVTLDYLPLICEALGVTEAEFWGDL